MSLSIWHVSIHIHQFRYTYALDTRKGHRCSLDAAVDSATNQLKKQFELLFYHSAYPNSTCHLASGTGTLGPAGGCQCSHQFRKCNTSNCPYILTLIPTQRGISYWTVHRGAPGAEVVSVANNFKKHFKLNKTKLDISEQNLTFCLPDRSYRYTRRRSCQCC